MVCVKTTCVVVTLYGRVLPCGLVCAFSIVERLNNYSSLMFNEYLIDLIINQRVIFSTFRLNGLLLTLL